MWHTLPCILHSHCTILYVTMFFYVGSRKIPIIFASGVSFLVFFTVFFKIPPLAYVLELSCGEKYRSKNWWPNIGIFGAKICT